MQVNHVNSMLSVCLNLCGQSYKSFCRYAEYHSETTGLTHPWLDLGILKVWNDHRLEESEPQAKWNFILLKRGKFPLQQSMKEEMCMCHLFFSITKDLTQKIPDINLGSPAVHTLAFTYMQTCMHMATHTTCMHMKRSQGEGLFSFTVAEVPGMQAEAALFRLLHIAADSVVTATIYVWNLKRVCPSECF